MVRVIQFSILVWCLAISMASAVFAATISNSGTEVEYEYEVEFRSLATVDDYDDEDAEEEALFHSAHVFGLFHSPEYGKRFGYNENFIEGFAGTKKPEIEEAEFLEVEGDDHLWVRYKASGTMLVLNRVVAGWLNGASTGTVILPLIQDLPAIYTEDMTYQDPDWVICTDYYYQSPADFSYFYNPFRCPELARPPIGQSVKFKISIVPAAKSLRFPAKEIYGDNENGKLTTLYFLLGFNATPPPGSSPQKIRSDSGYKVFTHIGRTLVDEHGFKLVEGVAELRDLLGASINKLYLLSPVTLESHQNRTYYRTYVRDDGENIWVARVAILNSDPYGANGRPLKSFAQFWQEAWRNGDVIYYGGHSGDGATLDVDGLEDRLQSFSLHSGLERLTVDDIATVNFSKNKTQIVMIDACSSYDHYLDMYREHKPRGLHLMTYGVVSLFHNAASTVDRLLQLTLEARQYPSRTWLDALRSIEEAQLHSQIDFLYRDPGVRTRLRNYYGQREEYPSYLLNVSVP